MKAVYFAIFILFVSSVFALPSPVGYVNDFGDILTDGSLENDLRAYESNTTIEIVIVTLESVPDDQTLFSYGVELFDQWNLGKSDDNGILVLLVKNGTTGNRMRIELGYGIQGYVTGAEAGRILDDAIPYYNNGDYDTTVRIILDGLYSQLGGYIPVTTPQGGPDMRALIFILSNFPFFIFLIVFIVSLAMRNRCPYCIRGKLVQKGSYYVCQRCGKKVTQRKRYAPVWVAGGWHGGGGGFGGFGGGASGGGGAGR